MEAGIIWLIVVVAVAAGIVAWTSEPFKTKLSQIGGVAFMLWIIVKIAAFLVGGASKLP